MVKLKIIADIDTYRPSTSKKFKILVKHWYGWRRTWNTNGVTFDILEFETYDEAEKYIVTNMGRNRIIEQDGNVYILNEITMYY